MRIELLKENGALLQAFTAKDWPTNPVTPVVQWKGKLFSFDHPINNGRANRVGYAYRAADIAVMDHYIVVDDDKKSA